MMPCEQFEHIKEIRQTYRGDSKLSKINQFNMMKIVAEDLNTTDTHFIFELIQNAEDNTYQEPLPYISFQLTKTDPTGTEGSDGALIVENNEIGFNHSDVSLICAGAQSTKTKKHDYIGEKGIGFKSVFRVTDNPHIFSGGYSFCLPEFDEEVGLGYVVPRWVNSPPEGLDPSVTHIILPLTKQDFGYDKIEEMLQDIEPDTILFLLKLQEIRIKTDTGSDLTILKDDSSKPEVQIKIEDKKHGVSSKIDNFLVCTRPFDKPMEIYHEKREGVRYRDVTVAFPLDKNSTAVGKSFAYLPVRTDTGFPFLINADFILASSREDIHQDVPWNGWLMDCISDLIATDLLPLLKERGLLKIDFLEKLSSILNKLAEDERNLFYPVSTRVNNAFMHRELLPANDNTFISAQSAKLADSEGLIDLLKPDQLSLLFEETGVIKWLVPGITARRTSNLWKYLTDKLKIDVVDPDMFARKINEHFLKNQSDNWFIDFYKFLFVGRRPPKSLWSYPWSVLRKKPILRLQNGSLVNPNKQDVYLSKEDDSDTTSRFVKIEIARNENAHKFLKELGIPQWDIVAEVIEHILPKYRGNSSPVPITEYDRDYSKIVTAYKTNSPTKKEKLRKVLQKTPFIVTEHTHEPNPCYGKPNELYFGTDELRLYFEGNNAYEFVSPRYSDKYRQMFMELGISDRIRITKSSTETTTGNVYLPRDSDCYRRGLNGFDPDIQVDGLEHALMNPSVAKSKIIWKHIVRPYSHCIKGKVLRSSRRDFSANAKIFEANKKTSDFGRLLMKNAWLPDSNGNMHKPSELTFKDLPEEFVCDEWLGDQLGIQKNAVAELAEETGIPVEVIEELRQNPERYAQFKAWMDEKETREPKDNQVPDVGGTNGNSTPEGTEGSEVDGGNTDSVDDEPTLHPPSRPSVKKQRGPQGDSPRHTPHRRPSGRNGGHWGGGGPGEEHEKLKNNIAQNPSQLGEGLKLIQKEYTFKSSNDRVDILLMDSSGRPVPVEVKPHIQSGSNDEVLQALKYKHLAADDYNILCKEVRCVLVAPEIPDDVKKKCRQLGIEPFIPTTANG